jgi:hypothetical protein
MAIGCWYDTSPIPVRIFSEGSIMSSSTDGSSHKSSKLGRKGDPRMHRAVSARLEDPTLTLYEALKIGGFDYPTNDDSSLIDSEKVTLGQRKNQLSRRLRLARKQNDGGESAINGGGEGNIYRGDANTFDTDTVERVDTMKKTRCSSLGARALQMKRDYDLTFDESDFAAADSANNINGMMEEQIKHSRIAKHHPDFAPLIVPPASFRGATNFNQHAPAPAVTMGLPQFAPPTNMVGSTGIPGLLSSGPYFNPQFSQVFSGQHQPRASAVAVSSLTSSAQAVGLTLEQLALALSSNTTSLAKLIAETKSGESMTKQQDLALNLFETESKSLYTKCMLMSGIDLSLAQPGTPTYMAFALKAWQAEGKRLQDMMNFSQQESSGMDPSDLSVGETTGAFKTTTEDVDAEVSDADNEVGSHSTHGNDRVHDHIPHRAHQNNTPRDDHCSSTCDAQHIHLLGQCGHKAIIHQPKDGAAHIDFIVNDQVECYMGLDSVPFGRSVDSAWPSKYKCKEVNGASKKTCCNSVLGAIDSNKSGRPSEPKILKLSEINLQDPEWNYDGGDSIDGGVMGLFKLGSDGSV